MKKLILSLLFIGLVFAGFAQHQFTTYVTASGTDTYAVTISVPTIANYSTKRIHLRFANANTGASTLNVTPSGASALGAIAIRAWDGDSWEALVGGEIVTGQDYVVVYNGTFFELYPSISGGGGGSGSVNDSLRVKTVSGTTYTPTQADHAYLIYLTNVGTVTITLDDALTAHTILNFRRDTGAGEVIFISDGTSVLTSRLDYDTDTLKTELATCTWIKRNSTEFSGIGAFGDAPTGGGGGSVTDVTGTTNRITSTGGTTPQIDISTSYAGQSSITNVGTLTSGATGVGFTIALATSTVTGLGTGVLPFLQTPSSANLAIALTDETGSGAAVFASAPTLTNPVVGTQSAGDNSTKAASTAYADAKVAEAITNGVTGIAPSEDQVFDALALKQSTSLTQNKFLAGNSSNIAAQYLLGSLTPEMYGAAGDGSTDDATALNALMTAASSAGVSVVFHAKTYIVGSTVTIPSGLTIHGSGANSIIRTSANIPIFTITSASNIHIYNISFDGSDSGAAQRGIYALGNAGLTQLSLLNIVHGCKFTDFGADGIYVTLTIGTSTGSNHEGTYQISDCVFDTNAGNGVNFDTRGEYNQIDNCKFTSNGCGIRNVGGNNSISNCSITDNVTGIIIGSGTNDGHAQAIGNKINHNTTNISCTSTATGYEFIANEIISGPITVNAATDIRFDFNDIDAATITLTNAVRCWFRGNYFRAASPTVTVASGNNPLCDHNYFAGTVPAVMRFNTVYGGIQSTQSGPEGPNLFTQTWTTTANNQYGTRFTGTITPRATTSDVSHGVWITDNFTATANSQQHNQLYIDGLLSAGAFSGVDINAAKIVGRTKLVDTFNSGSNGTLVLTRNDGTQYFAASADAVFRLGSNGTAAQFHTTSDGSAVDVSGNSIRFGVGLKGVTVSSSSGTTGGATQYAIGSTGTVSQTSGGNAYSSFIALQTINQTGAASGDVTMFDDQITLTAILGNLYGIRIRQATARSGFGLGATAPTAKIHIGAGTTGANTGPLKLTEGSNPTSAEDGLMNYVNNNLTFTEGSTVYTVAKTLTNTATLNFDLTSVNSQDLTITVTGAASGDAVSVGVDAGSATANVIFTWWVSATDTVTVRASRIDVATGADPASGTFRAAVIHY